jgi:hypothetical protein
MAKMDGVQTPEEYIDRLLEPRQSDVRRLHELITREAPELEPHASEDGIGYGKYRFRYSTGREGDWSTIGLASQKRYISLYVSGARHGSVVERYRDRLPKADISRWCVRIKRMADVDEAVLADLIREAKSYAGDYIES